MTVLNLEEEVKRRVNAALDEVRPAWFGKLLLTPTKTARPLLANAICALRKADEWQGVLGFDEFGLATMLLKPPPWLKNQDNWTPQRWTDCDDALCCEWLQRVGIGVNVIVAANAAQTVARDKTYHPVRDYLNKLKWDGQDRIAQFATTHLGAEASEYNTNISRCMFLAAAARIYRPGCKADYMPILEGSQDAGKSTAVSKLFSPWFSDDLAELGTKDSQMQIAGAWGIEVAELASMTRGEIERMKAFLTRRVDRFRPSYGRNVIEVPRQCIFIGTTNSDCYLKDETGGRRFWPIRCGRINLAGIDRDRDQIWAEAVQRFKAGEEWWLSERAAISGAREEQAARYQQDPWHDTIVEHLDGLGDTSIPEILTNALFIEKSRWTQAEQNRIARVLRTLHWERYRVGSTPRVWRYRRPSTSQ